MLVLAVLIAISSIGYYFASKLEPSVLSLIYIAVFYMPTPFYALFITSRLSKTSLNLGQYGTFKKLSISGILTTVGMFVGWILLFSLAIYLLSHVTPDLTGKFATSDTGVRANIATYFGYEAASTANLPSNILPLIIVSFIGAILSGFTVNLLFALGEEYGWRGYLRRNIKQAFLFKYTLIGVLWGAWHTPLVLQGYNYGNDDAIAGACVMIIFTIGMSYVFGVLLDRYDNVLYAGALHGMFNGFAGIFPLLLGGYNPLIGGPVGIVSAICFVIVAFAGHQLMQIRTLTSKRA